MATTADIENMEIQTLDIEFDNVDLGLTEDGSVQVNFNEELIDINNVDQFPSTVALFSTGMPFEINMTLLRSDIDYIFGTLLKNRTTVISDGSGNTAYYVKDVTQNLVTKVGRLKLHPRGVSGRGSDVTFPKAVLQFDATVLSYQRTDIKRLAVTIKTFTDPDADGLRAIFGDPSITSGNPDTCFITTGQSIINQIGVHVSNIDSTVGALDQIQGWSFEQTISTTKTGDIDEVGNVSATDIEFNIDNMVEGDFVVGDIIKVESEFIYVGGVTTLTSTTANLNGLIRGMYGSTAATHTDGISLAVCDNTALINRTLDGGTWASDTPATATIGDTPTGTGASRSGVINALAIGTTNLKVTVGTTDSPNTVYEVA